MTYSSKKYSLLAGLLLCAAASSTVQAASSILTFSVDLSSNTIPVTTVECRGTFNGYSGGFALTNNPLAANTNLYSGTINDTIDPNGGKVAYKFVINPGGNWETTASFQDRASRLPSTSGASLVLPTPFFADAGTPVARDVKFQVDMSQQIQLGNFTNDTSLVEVRGNFQGWSGGSTLVRDLSQVRTTPGGLLTTNVYTNTFTYTASPEATAAFKYVIQPGTGWEGPSTVNGQGNDLNRYFANHAQTLPVVDFSDAPFAPIAKVFFNVDMSAVLLSDPNYNPATVTLNGSFNGWSADVPCTNNATAPNTNLYTAMVPIGAGSTVFYQFRYNNGGTVYDNAPGGGNRSYTVPNVAVTNLPVIFFNNVLVSDLLNMDTLVTFSVSMTNAVGTDAHVWNGGADTVYINGDFTGWQPWNPIGLSGLNCTNNPPGTEVYSYTTNFLKGRPRSVKYKYAINGADDEAPANQDHFRYIRSTNGFYQMPLDTFGNQYGEPRFGNLSVGRRSGNIIPVTWLGYPGVHLQSRSNLISGSWQDLNATDSQSSTNWPVGGGVQFFRLVQP